MIYLDKHDTNRHTCYILIHNLAQLLTYRQIRYTQVNKLHVGTHTQVVTPPTPLLTHRDKCCAQDYSLQTDTRNVHNYILITYTCTCYTQHMAHTGKNVTYRYTKSLLEHNPASAIDIQVNTLHKGTRVTY